MLGKIPTIHRYDQIKKFPPYKSWSHELLPHSDRDSIFSFFWLLRHFVHSMVERQLLAYTSVLIDQILLEWRAYAISSDYSQVSVNVY